MGESAGDLAGPVVVVLNHPSWWDPLICLILSELFPQRQHYAPIDARSLEQYRFFARLGFFGIQPDSVAGARALLRVGQAILHDPRSMLWITAQGRFADVRERPLRLQSGVAHLLARCPQAIVLPLALELVFWNEPFPEALARFGEPVRGEETWAADRWLGQIEAALERNLDALSHAAQSRDGGRFLTILSGRQSQGGIYGWWRRLRHWAGSRKPERGRG
jgi:1-acyl-sn-glycerol-3-phosphate acyltransferase